MSFICFASRDSLEYEESSLKDIYRKVASSNTPHLEAHADFFRLFMKGIFDPYVGFLISNAR